MTFGSDCIHANNNWHFFYTKTKIGIEIHYRTKQKILVTSVRPHVPLQQRRPVEALLAEAAVQHVLRGPGRLALARLGQRQIQRPVHGDWPSAAAAVPLNTGRPRL